MKITFYGIDVNFCTNSMFCMSNGGVEIINTSANSAFKVCLISGSIMNKSPGFKWLTPVSVSIVGCPFNMKNDS